MAAVGIYLYEDFFWSEAPRHAIIFLVGISLIIAGGLWLAADWFDL
jgi:hypothetical protein